MTHMKLKGIDASHHQGLRSVRLRRFAHSLRCTKKKTRNHVVAGLCLVEMMGIEPTTS